MKKKVVTIMLSAIMVFVMGTSAFAASGTWQNDGYGWWYAYDAGGYAASRWENIDGFWYHFNSYGYMDTGWIWDGFAWYYMNPNGTMATDWVWDGYNWYYMGSDGAMKTDWVKIGNDWYYLGSSGAMQTGWVYWGDAWFYLQPNGVKATGWVWDGYNWYYLDSDGAMKTGWVKDGDYWYFLDLSTGVRYTGWLWDGSVWHFLDSYGVMLTGTHVIDGKTYYFDETGAWQGEVKTYADAYIDLLNATNVLDEGYPMPQGRVAVTDINNDGIPELIFPVATTRLTPNYAPFTAVDMQIWSYVNGTAVHMGTFFDYVHYAAAGFRAFIYKLKDGTICYQDFGGDEWIRSINVNYYTCDSSGNLIPVKTYAFTMDYPNNRGTNITMYQNGIRVKWGLRANDIEREVDRITGLPNDISYILSSLYSTYDTSYSYRGMTKAEAIAYLNTLRN